MKKIYKVAYHDKPDQILFEGKRLTEMEFKRLQAITSFSWILFVEPGLETGSGSVVNFNEAK